MTSKTNTFSGGTNGAALTTSDTGSGDAVNAVDASEPTYSTAAAWHGTLGMAAATAAVSRFQWTGFASTSMAVRGYYKVTIPTASTQIAQVRTGAGAACGFTANSGGALNFVNSAGTGVLNSTSLTSRAGTTIRIEMQVTSSATVGTIAYQLFDGDGTTAFDSGSVSNVNTRGGNFTSFFVGNISGTNYGTNPLFDDIAAADGTTTALGPSSNPVTVADTASGADAATVAAAVPLAETASGSDSATVTATVAIADTAASSDALTAIVAVTLADTGTGTDALSVAAGSNPSLPDLAAGADSLAVSATSALTDAGSSADAATITGTIPLADTGIGGNAIAVTSTVPLAELGVGTDVATVNATVPLPDTAHGADAATITTTATVADSGAGTDAVSVAVGTLALSQTATGTDAITVQAGSNPLLPDVGAGTDTLTTTVTSQLADTAHATDGITVVVTLAVADAAAAADVVTAQSDRVLSITVTVGTDRWAIATSADRWSVTTGHDRWTLATGSDRWSVTIQEAP